MTEPTTNGLPSTIESSAIEAPNYDYYYYYPFITEDSSTETQNEQTVTVPPKSDYPMTKQPMTEQPMTEPTMTASRIMELLMTEPSGATEAGRAQDENLGLVLEL
jgi:hypothetical protein